MFLYDASLEKIEVENSLGEISWILNNFVIVDGVTVG